VPTPSSETSAANLKTGARDDRRLVYLGVLIAVAVGIPVGLSLLTGSMEIPHNDAWSHSKIAQTFAQSGVWEFLGWNRTALVGQIVILGPLASSILAQQFVVAVFGVVALVSIYLYTRNRIGGSGALLVTAVVAATAEFGLLSTSFMSDIPALAGVFLGLLLTDVALRRESRALLSVALLVELWAATVREQSIVALVATVTVVALSWRGSRRFFVIAFGVFAFFAFIAFEIWRRSQAFGDPPIFEFNPPLIGGSLIRTPMSLGFLLLPVTLLVANPRAWSRIAQTGAVTSVVLATLFALKRQGDVFLGNYLSPSGAYSAVMRGEREVFSTWVWMTLVVLSIAGLGLLAGHLIHHGIRADRLTLIVLSLLMLGTLGQLVTGQMVFARYLLPAIPLISIILLRSPDRLCWARSLVALGALTGVALALTANALAFDAARWHLAKDLVEAGLPAENIDAGLEWNGYHWNGPYRPDWVPAPSERQLNASNCRVLSPSPIAGRVAITTSEYKTFAVLGHSRLFVYDCQP
jgi:hypothetical protein